jgi:predicted nucleic acid-binding protein
MILVDTSVWVEVFRRTHPLDLEALVSLDDVVTCLPVVQEVLQGFRDEGAHRLARESLLSFPVLDAPAPLEAFLDAAALFRAARRSGKTVRSGVDCLIAASALRHGATVLHRDRDFAALASVSALQARSLS